ncbi:hypothetical protein HHI36_010594 [Cryptolaemus montrouzieri]|uniref:Uncharacterized protein n=1 Tax=Cryptolaemus montrouzieri TaxID=559131 RepID=A0ABD2MJ98_9CUCU
MFDNESTQDGGVSPAFWRQHTCSFQLHNLPGVPRRSTACAQAIRDEFAEYFVSQQGELSFQHDKISRVPHDFISKAIPTGQILGNTVLPFITKLDFPLENCVAITTDMYSVMMSEHTWAVSEMEISLMNTVK